VLQRLRALGRDLTGRSDVILMDLLVGQIDATIAGARLARQVAGGQVASGIGRERMVDIEHRGDDWRARLVVELASALAPPMDREDLFRLSRSVDDVLDNLRDLVRELDLFDIDREPLLDDPLGGVERGVLSLREAVAAFVARPESARVGALAVKKNEVRPRYQQAVARLLVDDGVVTGLLLKRRELLRRVDVIGLRLGEAADALADGAIKRSH